MWKYQQLAPAWMALAPRCMGECVEGLRDACCRPHFAIRSTSRKGKQGATLHHAVEWQEPSRRPASQRCRQHRRGKWGPGHLTAQFSVSAMPRAVGVADRQAARNPSYHTACSSSCLTEKPLKGRPRTPGCQQPRRMAGSACFARGVAAAHGCRRRPHQRRHQPSPWQKYPSCGCLASLHSSTR